ncbi:TonB-dependent siderophore receptor [Methylomonas albis]|uniref:TonB-dependent receptor n=1 Tax=Methylomonas albis TaxID=1854563 RepID=A0ABR9CU95_9GAMM|nr:TonB-dependent receptor [Methylomonas albis]MBD9354365.1 TonB-dependent receptor [Methylomonas albis]CAD6877236.1 TonB-dependent siderophore receptor [Methylomonas albis]
MTLKNTFNGGLPGHASVLVFGALLAVSGAAVADSASRAFNIPAGSLSTALNRLAESGGLQLVYDAAIAEGLQSKGISGNYTPEAALKQLLSNSGLSYRVAENGNVLIERQQLNYKQEPTALPAVNVVGKTPSSFDGEDPYNKDYMRPNAITATKTDTPLMQTPMSVKVVPQQVLKDQQAITVDQALSNVSGVTSGLGGSGMFFMRGFGNYNVYRDGFLNQSQWAHTEDLANIERVEVLKGPGSLLYGRSEPGGLVNFVTKQPLDTPYYSLRQQFGSFDMYRTSVDATGPLTANKDLAYRFNLGYQSNHSFQEFGGNERLLVAPSLRWNISDRTTSTLKLEYSDIKEMGLGKVPLQGNRPASISRALNLGDPWNFQEDEYVMLSLNTEHAFNDDWKLRHRFNFSNHELTMSGIFAGTPSVQPNGDVRRIFFAQNTDGGDYQHNFFNALELTGKFDTGALKHTLLVGGDYYRTDYRASSSGFGDGPNQFDTSNIYNPIHRAAPPVIPADAISYSNYSLPWFGLYAQDQIELPYHVHVMGGLRYDSAETTGTSSGLWGGPIQSTSEDRVSPRGGIVWQPLPELSFYGSYTENFGQSNAFMWNKPLPPQTAQQWETGVKTELFDGRFMASVAYFDLKKQNVPMQVDPLTTKAIGAAESRGIEFDVSGEILPGWNVIGGYAYTPFAKTTKDSFDGSDAGNTGLRLNNAPKHNGSLWTTYEIQGGDLQGLKVGAGVKALSQREIGYDESAQAPGYATLNLMGSQAWKVGKSKITAQLNVDNLLDKTYTASIYSYGPTYYGAPRTFMGAIKIEY